jgi:hypothetical protein
MITSMQHTQMVIGMTIKIRLSVTRSFLIKKRSKLLSKNTIMMKTLIKKSNKKNKR